MATRVWLSGNNTETVGYCYWSSRASAHYKGAFNTACFHFQFRVWSKERKCKPTHCLEKWERSDFIKQQWEEKTGCLNFRLDAFPLSGLQWLPENQQNHGGTVESSFACFVHLLIYLYLLYVQTSIAQRNKETVFFFFTCCYVVS